MANEPTDSTPAAGVLACATLALLLVTPMSVHAGKQSASPLHLAVEVVYGDEVGPESFREALQRDLLRAIRQEQCYASVNEYDEEIEARADLLLRLIIHDIDDRTEYETTLAQRDTNRQRPNMPNEKQPMVIHLEAEVDLRLHTLPDRLEVRSRDFREHGSFRPRYAEDARYETEQLVLETLARSGRTFVCKGTGKKLSQEIEHARKGGD